MIYQPEEDSYLIEKEVRKISRGERVLDMGCGSGILMNAAISSRATSVLGVDIDSQSLDYCKRIGLKVIRSDLFECVVGKFDLIIFNPPYLPEDSREDMESSIITTGGKNGNELILRFLSEVCEYLEEDGEILLLVSSLTNKNPIERAIIKLGMEKRVVAEKKVFMELLEVWEINRKT